MYECELKKDSVPIQTYVAELKYIFLMQFFFLNITYARNNYLKKSILYRKKPYKKILE